MPALAWRQPCQGAPNIWTAQSKYSLWAVFASEQISRQPHCDSSSQRAVLGSASRRQSPWWASALMMRWLVSFSFLRKRLCNFIPIIVRFERFLDDCKKNCGAIKLFLLFFLPRLLSGALAVMVDRKEIKWTIYYLLWGWARAGRGRRCGPGEQDALPLLFRACGGLKCNFSLSFKYWEFSLEVAFLSCGRKKSSLVRKELSGEKHKLSDCTAFLWCWL